MKEYAMTHRHLPSDAKAMMEGKSVYDVHGSEMSMSGAARSASSASPLLANVLMGRGRNR